MADWNSRYSENDDQASWCPSVFLEEHISLLPKGRALDIAAGRGRNSFFLAENSYHVDAIDFSEVAIEKGRKMAEEKKLNIDFIHADLTKYDIPLDTYDLIINFNYLEKPLIPSMKKGLKKGGAILFETYTVEQSEIGPPRNTDYLLKPNELLALFSDLHVICYREGVFVERDRKKAVASIIAKKE